MEKKGYIERGALMYRLGYYYDHTSGDPKYAYGVALKEVRSAPAADVAPVVHGEWIHNPMREYDYICSVCRGDAPENRMRNNAILTPYCPHCGAKMDGGNRNADA